MSHHKRAEPPTFSANAAPPRRAGPHCPVADSLRCCVARLRCVLCVCVLCPLGAPGLDLPEPHTAPKIKVRPPAQLIFADTRTVHQPRQSCLSPDTADSPRTQAEPRTRCATACAITVLGPQDVTSLLPSPDGRLNPLPKCIKLFAGWRASAGHAHSRIQTK